MVTNTAIIGAGPYGLSTAAYLRHHGVPFRIFGRPMDSWAAHMPKDMLLKSDGFASNIYDPQNEFTLEKFCAERGIEYAREGLPVRRETFTAYGAAFKDRMVPELEDKMVAGLSRAPEGFKLELESGETVFARRVVMAVGITHFAQVPENLAALPSEFVSHSFRHYDLEPFRGRTVAVIGGGSSALDLAGLLRDCDADVQLVARARTLHFHSTPTGKPRSWWQSLRNPKSGLGPGLQSRFFAEAPGIFHYWPEALRVKTVQTHLGPSGGWFIKNKVVGRVPLMLGSTIQRAVINDARVQLQIRCAYGSERSISADHVIAATGYKVNLERLQFVSADIRSQIKVVQGYPALSSSFESSVPGLYFVGVSAANSFGPVMRFAFGAKYAAKTVARAMLKSIAQSPAWVQVPVAIGTTK